ncbi:efflux transporter outer membrane subunit [Methylocapsa acidiphila]|uniref:efflux transporter outer membrane subunit n=1 Tax=Methylocapsa acidiphila TaxID=133552 RepID=UPI0004019898|nr:efflux transporter outer membrane subunit [Methylocapsa acidiphila]
MNLGQPSRRADRPKRALLGALALASMLAAAGCSVGPDFMSPDPHLPQASFFGPPSSATETGLPPGGPTRSNFAQVDPRWWDKFNDRALSTLADKAARVNLDVRTASIRLAESRFQRGVTASALFPTINASPSYQREQYSENGVLSLASGFTGQPIHVPPVSVYQVGFDASWEIDLWGHVRRQVEAAEAEVESSEYQRRDALVATLAEVARDYVELRGVQTQIAIANANLASSNDILQLTRTRAEKGLTTGLDVENAAAQVESVRAQLPSLENQESAYINALSLLLDEPPGSLKAELAKAKPIPPTPPRAPVGLPSELARRRPDIRRAEAELHAATANIGVAVADFYPSVKFNGSAGFNALDLKNLWKGSSLQYQLGPSITLPIFEGGRLKSTLDLGEAQQQEAYIAYHKTVLQAWHEVVNALVAYRTEQERRARLKAQVEHSRQALSLSRSRYNNGVGDFLNVLDAQRTVLQAELQHAQSATAVSTDFVQLYKALGGGWELAFPAEDAASVASAAQ